MSGIEPQWFGAGRQRDFHYYEVFKQLRNSARRGRGRWETRYLVKDTRTGRWYTYTPAQWQRKKKTVGRWMFLKEIARRNGPRLVRLGRAIREWRDWDTLDFEDVS